MTFYHFTANRFVESIKAKGLTNGCIVTSTSPVKFQQGVQWITKNPEFDQSWLNPKSKLPYKRNEVRLTIEIPETDSKLRQWINIKDFYLTGADLSAYGDPENWFCYFGKIKPESIVKIEAQT